MIKSAGILITALFLTSCSFYSSTGRKQFEEKAPSQIQAQAAGFGSTFVQCRPVSSAEMWVHGEFPADSQEIVELLPNKEVWKKVLADGSLEITQISKSENGSAESCVYGYSSEQTWLENRTLFLNSASTMVEDLD